MIKLIIDGGTLQEIREQVMQAAADFLNFGIVAKDGKVSVMPKPEPGRFVETHPEPAAKPEPISFRVEDRDSFAPSEPWAPVLPAEKPYAGPQATMPEEVPAAAQEELPPAKRKPGRPPGKKKTPESILADIREQRGALAAAGEMEAEESAQAQAPSARAGYTAEDAMTWIRKVFAAKGKEAAKQVIESFGANKVSQIDPANYPALKIACEALLP